VGKPKYELAQVVRKFGRQLIGNQKLSPQQNKALFNILQCRTASLGGHQDVCDCCGQINYSYNSCNDRHCPKCQGNKQALWIEKLEKSTLPIKHYHIIFTVPHCLNKVCLWNGTLYYNLLFKSVWETLRSFGYTHFGVESGAVTVLHTWGQNLSLHPHIHCIVPAAGYSLKGRWKNIGKYENYLYPVHQLSAAFKGKFLDNLKRKLRKMDNSSAELCRSMADAFDGQIQKAYKTNWVVFSEASMAQAKYVIRYLGQYTHRVAISNRRIIHISDTHVTFLAKDYRDRAQKKPVTLKGAEFLRRFCQHIMPQRFVRIRRYGIYNPTTIRNLDLQFTSAQTQEQPAKSSETKSNGLEGSRDIIKLISDSNIRQCPICKKGKLLVLKQMPRIRSPAGHLPTILFSLLQ
jgi:hypothetical protein